MRDSAHLTLDGPLGIGGVQVNSQGETLEVVNAHGEHIGNDLARAELRTRLGFDVPLASLRYWILGVPRPDAPAEESLDPAQQRLESLTQDGWHVAYGAYVGRARPDAARAAHSASARPCASGWSWTTGSCERAAGRAAEARRRRTGRRRQN